MDNQFEFLVYRTAEEDISINAVVKDETIWLTQKAMGELFGVDKSSISRHLKNIFAEGELQEEVVVAKFATTTPHGAIEGKTQTKDTQFYNLDAIISVGYRVNSHRATQFRIWATGVLKEYMTKGFALDDDRLKQGKTAFGKITSVSCLSAFAQSVPASAASGSRSQIFSPSAASTMTAIPRSHMISTPWCRTNFTMPLSVRLRPRSSTPTLTGAKTTWG